MTSAVTCGPWSALKTELREDGEAQRLTPREIEDSEFVLDVQTIVVAVGQGANPPLLTRRLPGLELNEDGTIAVHDRFGATSIPPRIWAGGDAVTGAAVVITAMGGRGGKRRQRAYTITCRRKGTAGKKKAEGMS